jgi:autotransporter-associated beta strand protein
LAVGALVASGPFACAQIATLDKGHQLLVNNGLQIWGLDQCAGCTFNYNGLANANFNGVMWSWGVDDAPHPKLNSLANGQKWGKWQDPNVNPASALDATEQSRSADLIAMQVGDEQQSDLENPNGVTKAWFQAAHAGNYFQNQLLYVNSFYVGSDAAYATFIADANPDAISFDSYPFDTPYGSIIFPNNWLAKAGQFRRHALSSYLGIGNNAPRPYGLYLQTYNSSSEGTRDPGDVEMRWQQFTAWTMGFTFVDAFTVSGSSSLFTGGNMNSPTQPRYAQFAETARQGRNLGPALTHLISYGYGPSIVTGKDSAGNSNPVPSDWLPFNKANAPANQQYLTSVSAQNIGTKNNAQPGDVYIGFFNPLLTSYGDPAGTAYFMVMNALGPYLNDPTATVADCMQRLTLNFDFTGSNITSLQRLRRSDGQVEVVPLTHLSGNQYQLTFDLEGGTGDLFKYNDGSPFVGVQLPPTALYWDNDANAGNNNTGTGAGLGGSGTWDTSASKWFNGSANVAWTANNDAVFAGTAGTVTLAAPQSVTSLSFKTNGYTLTGSTLTLASSSINVDSGATATINSAVTGSLGLVKSGAGTLQLGGTNTYTGGTTVSSGTLQVASDANLGATPASFAMGNITLNGGTLRFGGSFDVSNNRGIMLGASGGTIDTQGFNNPSGYNATAGGFSGAGDLTKLGSGTFFAAATTGGANTTWKGKLILKEGVWKIVASDGLPYNVPAADGVQLAQVTFDSGTLQIGATMNVTNGRRGMTVAAGGGTIDTQANNFTWAGPLNSTSSAVVWNKTGSGQLQFNTPATVSGNFSGTLNVNGGTLLLNGGGAMGDLASIQVANTAGVALAISGSETIGSLAGGGTAGGNVSMSTGLITGGNNSSTTFGGLLSGAGGLIKVGSGTFTLARAAGNTYTGTTTINGGTLLVNNSNGTGTGANSVIVNSGGILGGTGIISGAVIINSGGHIAPGASVESLDVGSVTLAAGSMLDFELDTLAGVDVSDLLNVTITNGLTINGGTLNIADAGGMSGGIYTLIDYAGALNGSFSNLALGTTPSGFAYSLIHDASNKAIQLEVTAPGDFNHDGAVDGGDYVVLRKGLGSKYTAADFDAWRANFGKTYANGAGAALSAVPEPSAVPMLGVGAVIMLAGYRQCVLFSPRCR